MRRALSRARARFGARARWVRWPVLAGFGLFGLAVVGFAVLWATVDLPEESPLPRSSVILAADGTTELAAVAPEGVRVEVALDEVADVAVDAVVAAEDHRFYSHGGVDPIGIARAIWQNVRTDDTQGGSTITQQLVKQAYTQGDRSFTRKLREAVLAIKLERTEDKDRILERYVNTVYFGRNAYGIEAAARAYFDRPAAQLELHQAALLAGLIRSPETADPTESPEEATRRRGTVLQAMIRTGTVTEEEARAADAAPLGASNRQRLTSAAAMAPHFIDRAREEAIAAVGEAAVYGGGLRIVTTLDPAAQLQAEAAVAETLTEPDDPQAALIALGLDGAIRAYVGGRDYDALQLDLVRGAGGGGSGRQPGSTFKPFVLAAALSHGITLADRYEAPAEIEIDTGGEPWVVHNYGNEAYDEIDVAEATANSVNTVYAQLLAEVGPNAVVDAAHVLGIESELAAEPSIALGTEEVSVQELARAFLTLADDGNKVEPYGIARIEDADGDLVWEPDLDGAERVIDEGVARAITHALRGVIENGTGTAADIGRPAAGKTGTTQDNVDAWFAGYVPGYAAVVWMGYPDGAVAMDDVHGRSVTGGSFPAQIWARFMSAAMEGREIADFPEPPEELLEPSDRPSSTETTPTTEPVEDSTATTSPDESTTTAPSTSSTTAAPSTTATTEASTTTAPTGGGGGGGGGGVDSGGTGTGTG